MAGQKCSLGNYLGKQPVLLGMANINRGGLHIMHRRCCFVLVLKHRHVKDNVNSLTDKQTVIVYCPIWRVS